MDWASTVAGNVGSLGGDFLHHLRAHVLEFVFELDFLGHGHTVLGHGRGAEGAIQHHVAAFRAEGHFYGVGQDVHTGDHLGTGRIMKAYVFCSHIEFLLRICNEIGAEERGVLFVVCYSQISAWLRAGTRA
jgi:hypothetical protein